MRQTQAKWLDIWWPGGWQFASSTMTEATKNLKFLRKPSPVLAEHRPLYKICQILLVLNIASRSGRSRLPRLHLFNWALKSPERCQQLIVASREKLLRVRAWGFDPALAIAIRFAIAEGLIRETSTSYELTDKGTLFVTEILKIPDHFSNEKRILGEIGKGITENMVENVAKGWEAS
jgi:hypothetical protein